MNQEFSYSHLTAMDGINGATVLKFHSKPGRGIFYSQTTGNEEQLQLSASKFTGTPALIIPAVTFTSSKFALRLSPRGADKYTLHQVRPDHLENQ
jgi:hypothetical protein